jgi:hypothetical protein
MATVTGSEPMEWTSEAAVSKSSLSCAFRGGPVWAIRGEEVSHRGGNLDDVCLDREMSGIKELNLRAG